MKSFQFRRRWPVLAAFIFSIPLVAGLGPGANPDFGLKKGTSWTYSISFGDEVSEYGLTVAKVIPEKNQTIFELQTALKDRTSYSYRSLRSDGLYKVANTTMSGPGYDSDDVDPIIRQPLLKGSSWKWLSPFRGQTSSGPDGKAPDIRDLTESCKATIETVNETVTVPAGTFKCYRVRFTKTSKANGTSTYLDWISEEAGLVRRHIPAKGEDQAGRWELVKFTRGQ